MAKTGEMDALITELRDAAAVINSVATTLAEMFSAEPKEETKPAPTLPEVRAILAEKSRAGFTAQIKELLLKHGSEKLSGIDPAEFPTLLKEAEVLGNG